MKKLLFTFCFLLSALGLSGQARISLYTRTVALPTNALSEISTNVTGTNYHTRAIVEWDRMLAYRGWGLLQPYSAVLAGITVAPLTNAALFQPAAVLSSIASNASTAQIDFSTTTTHYECTNLANAITLQLTNTGTSAPKDVWVYLRTDGTARNVTVSTNGITTGLRVSWGFNSATNGATSFTATNRVRLNLARVLGGELHAAYEHGQ